MFSDKICSVCFSDARKAGFSVERSEELSPAQYRSKSAQSPGEYYFYVCDSHSYLALVANGHLEKLEETEPKP